MSWIGRVVRTLTCHSWVVLRILNSALRMLRWSFACVVVVGCARQPLAIPLVSPLLPPPKPSVLFREPFDQLDPSRWKEVEVRDRTHYTLEGQEYAGSLKAHSRAGASILLCPVRFDPDTYEWLSWRWRVDRLVDGEDLTRKDGSDAAARVYVYFDTTGLPWEKRSLDYVWSANLPVGTIMSSAYARHSKIIVVESGSEHLGTWRTVSRDIEEDYKRCFGEDPSDVVAIGLMVDTDNTRSEAIAYFDDVMITRGKPPAPSPARAP